MQVVKDPLKTKGARLSMELTIAGRYMVYTPTGEGVGVSRRLEDHERERLRRETEARPRRRRRDHPHRRARRQARRLRARARTCSSSTRCSTARRGARRAGRSSSRRPTSSVRVVRDVFSAHFERAIVDDEQQHHRLVSFFARTAPELVDRVELYQRASSRCSRPTRSTR